MAGSVLVTPATALPVTIQEVKDWSRIVADDEDALLEALLPNVVRQFELRTGKALLTQTWDFFLDEFPGTWPYNSRIAPYYRNPTVGQYWWEDWIELPCYPVQSVTSVKYNAYDGSTVTLSSTAYYVDTVSPLPRVYPSVTTPWPTIQLRPANGVEVRFVAGYTSAELIPEEHRQTLKRMVDYAYQNRDGDVSPELEQALTKQSTRLWA